MPTNLTTSLKENLDYMKSATYGSSDFTVRQATIQGIDIAIVTIEGMVDGTSLTDLVVKTFLISNNIISSSQQLYDYIQKNSLVGLDVKEISDYKTAFQLLMSGFAMVIVDGVDKSFIVGAQGFPFRSVSEPSGETNIRGSKEGFIEPIKMNLALIRRRIKSPELVFEMSKLGTKSATDICIVYLKDMVSDTLLTEIKRRLSEIKIEVILESGYIIPFLQGDSYSIFTDIGTTERPDTVAAKISEGRVAILVDGTPYVLIVPFLFSENFQSADDYSHRPYYATFIRLLKYFSFFMTILLPGFYVGAATFHPEIFPSELLYNVVSAQKSTPFPLMIEAIIIHIIFEIMREAGLRLPKQIGHAVSIVGSLVIGTAAVTAGIIGSPMLIIVAITSISSFVVPSIYEPVAILRFVFILLSGLMGFYGMALGIFFLIINITKLTSFGVPYTAPLTPFSKQAMRDVFYRENWKKLQNKTIAIQNLNGVHISNDGNEGDK